MKKRLEACISGRVQMVMFRDFAMRYARALELTGQVWNTNDGSVMVVAEGNEETLQRYLKLLKVGPLLARVDKVETIFSEARETFNDFCIIR